MIRGDLADLVAAILEKQGEFSGQRSLLVAVSGIDGSGKGYITEKLVTSLNQHQIQTVSLNLDIWHNLPSQRFDAERSPAHFYHHAFNFEGLFEQLILPLQKQRSINLTTVLTGLMGIPQTYKYQFTEVDVIVVEGIFLFKRSLLPYYDLKIWIECDWDTALARAIARNQEGISEIELVQDYQNLYFPAQKLHLQLDSPQSRADLVYFNSSERSP